ncbi:hypothetical protein B0H10DRAFT_1966176 [Mycena sp. CBHHK59/15]|nr:hypothetical protein B0H10DRAFT_1966176 [Mycena sp. CBHHK59/15]
MNLKRAGIAHDNPTRSPGDLALFCVSCPQPGKNVTIEEVKLSADLPQIVVDGNFKLENLKMRNPEDDVRLSDGQMFFVGSVLYDEHVRITPEQKQRSNCNNHRAVNETNVKRKEVDSTGIGACFQLGERQKNMDYGISEVFRQLPPEIKQMLLMYDISCQWVLHWIQRFKEGKYLFYRKDLELFPGVGKFHLGAHILECFWEFSLNFMEGSGQEVLDNYMNDSNWKKMVGSGKMDRATAGLASTQDAFDELSIRVGKDITEKWAKEERDALAPGGIGRKIYKAAGTDDPGASEMCVRLAEEQMQSNGNLSGSIALIAEGLNIQQAQNSLAMYRSSLGKRPTASEKRDLIGKVDRLQKRITKFEKAMSTFMLGQSSMNGNESEETESDEEQLFPGDDDDLMEVEGSDYGDEDGWSEAEDEDDEDAGTTCLVENIRLSLPSSSKAKHVGAEQYKDLSLGEKAWMLRNNVRDASGGKDKLRAWSGVTKKSKDVRKHLKIYNHARSALQRMGQGEKWKPITKTDLNMKGDMIEANRSGQRAHTLAWFWRLEDSPASDEIQQSGKMLEFYRVNWLRAKARVDRWKEEGKFVVNEMVWTVNSFKYQCNQWKLRVEAAKLEEEDGLQAYAEKQVDLWESFAVHGKEMFDWAKRFWLLFRNTGLSEVPREVRGIHQGSKTGQLRHETEPLLMGADSYDYDSDDGES